MSFYSYKNGNTDCCPGNTGGNPISGLSEKVCIQVKKVYDSCIQQTQLDEVKLILTDIMPVLPDCGCGPYQSGHPCHCDCLPDPIIPAPLAPYTFESCRSSSTVGEIRDLSIDRLCDRPQFARIRCNVDIPIDILFSDCNCNEYMGQSVVTVKKDVLLCIPNESIVPFTLEACCSAICVTGRHLEGDRFEITICVTCILKVLAEVQMLVPSYGFCPVPPCEEFAENVCDEFFSLPLFPPNTDCSGSRTPAQCAPVGSSNCGCYNHSRGCSGYYNR